MTDQPDGEFSFLNNFLKPFEAKKESDVILGIGDDAAAIAFGNETLLISCDSFYERVHFDLRWDTPKDIGYKAVQASISDIAAMGGRPTHILSSIAATIEGAHTWLSAVFEGMREAVEEAGIELVGGDLSHARVGASAITITALGKVARENIKTRSGAQKGDVIVVTGPIGGARAGLLLLWCGLQGSDELVTKHRRPQAEIGAGAWLGKQPEVTAMIDLSDGLAGDIEHILRQSSVGASIELSALPVSDPLLDAAAENGWDPHTLAATGGDDFRLLFTVSSSAAKTIQAKYFEHFGLPLFPIGTITSSSPVITWTKDGNPTDLNIAGYDHFAP